MEREGNVALVSHFVAFLVAILVSLCQTESALAMELADSERIGGEAEQGENDGEEGNVQFHFQLN